MYRKILPFLIASFFFLSASAQNELSLQLMPELLQSTKMNPALAPKEKLVISLPGIFGNYYHNVGSVGELLQSISDSTVRLNVDALLENLMDENTLRINQEFENLHVSYRLNDKVTLSLHQASKSSNYLFYPESLPRLFLQGNSQFIDQEIAFGPDQHTIAYNEIGLGTALSFGKLQIGAKVKLLLGVGDISTERTDVSLYTDPDVYQLTINSDYLINSSSFSEVLLFDTLSGYNIEYSWREMIQFKNFTTKNRGYALDLGMNYEVSDRLSIGASILDLGKINWKNDVVNYTSKGSNTFSGLDLKGALTGDSLSITSSIDTVRNIFDFQTSINNYETKIPTRVYMNATYKLNNKVQLAATVNNEFYRGRNFFAFGLGAHYTLNKNFSAGLTYSVRNNAYFNIGLNLIARKGPVQFFLATDNIAVAVQPYGTNNINARVGLNLVFDELKKQEKK
ncbi:MAG: opacity protein-like surface antigen [Polaribacter sp.]|jgi:opacity protein-like surface antigen